MKPALRRKDRIARFPDAPEYPDTRGSPRNRPGGRPRYSALRSTTRRNRAAGLQTARTVSASSVHHFILCHGGGKLLLSPVQVSLDSTERQVEQARDLFIRSLFHVEKCNRLPVFLRKLWDEVRQIGTAEFLAFNGLLCIDGIAHLRFIKRQPSVATFQRCEASIASDAVDPSRTGNLCADLAGAARLPRYQFESLRVPLPGEVCLNFLVHGI